jgi:aminoglycoside phosphotransferase (APT) family kinase protein
MNLPELHSRVTAQVRMLAAGLALDPATLDVRPIVNLGGFVRASFSIADAGSRYHLKLAGDADGHAALRRWHDVGNLLAGRYRAPKVCGWLEIVDTPYAGLLLEHVEGHAPDLSQTPAVTRALNDLLGRLHADRQLAGYLPGPASSCCDAFLLHQFERLGGELERVRGARPEFVSAEDLAWLGAELDRVTAKVRASAAFAAPANVPVHGDLHDDKVLVAADGRFVVLGWDDLRLGDPAVDLARLPPPTEIDPRADTLRVTRATREPWLSERVALLRRAHALSDVIDPLVAWLAADAWPEVRDELRASERRAHAEALAVYRQTYA